MTSLLMQAYERKEAARMKLLKMQRPATLVPGGRGGGVAVPGGSGAFSLPVNVASKTSVDGASGAPGGVAGAGAVLGSRVATGTLVEGGAAPVSGINLARAGY